jgi:hypothetical protein
MLAIPHARYRLAKLQVDVDSLVDGSGVRAKDRPPAPPAPSSGQDCQSRNANAQFENEALLASGRKDRWAQNKRTASSARPLAAVTRLKSDRGLGQGERVTRYCGERLDVSGGLISIPACAAMKLWLRSHTSLTAAAKLGRIKNPAKSYRKHVCFWMPRTRSGRRGGMQETLEKHPACGAGCFFVPGALCGSAPLGASP